MSSFEANSPAVVEASASDPLAPLQESATEIIANDSSQPEVQVAPSDHSVSAIAAPGLDLPAPVVSDDAKPSAVAETETKETVFPFSVFFSPHSSRT
jgi:hypothetical protein